MLILRLLFGGLQSASASSNSNTFQSGGNSKTEISRTLDQESSMIADLNQEQPEQVLKGTQTALKIPSGGDSSRPSKFGPGSKARGAARRDFARRQAGKNSPSRQSGGGFVADAFTVKPQYPARPGRLEPFGKIPPKLWTAAHNPGTSV